MAIVRSARLGQIPQNNALVELFRRFPEMAGRPMPGGPVNDPTFSQGGPRILGGTFAPGYMPPGMAGRPGFQTGMPGQGAPQGGPMMGGGMPPGIPNFQGVQALGQPRTGPMAPSQPMPQANMAGPSGLPGGQYGNWARSQQPQQMPFTPQLNFGQLGAVGNFGFQGQNQIAPVIPGYGNGVMPFRFGQPAVGAPPPGMTYPGFRR